MSKKTDFSRDLLFMEKISGTRNHVILFLAAADLRMAKNNYHVKIFTCTIILMLFSFNLKSQSIRHVKGNEALDAGIHFTKFSPAYSFGYANYFRENIVFKIRANYEFGKIGLTDYKALFLIPSGTYTPYNFKSIVYLNFELGGVIGFENGSNSDFIDSDNSFVSGMTIGIELETFLGSRIALLTSINELLTFGSKFGNARYQLGVGLRIFIK